MALMSIGFPLVIMAGLDHRFGWSSVFLLWIIVLGIILIALGYAFSMWALVENRFFSSVVRIQADRGHMVCDSAHTESCGIRAMPDMFCHCWALRWP
jgi:protein-S-isoprenylcysteine O-methyltransferase Ste14